MPWRNENIKYDDIYDPTFETDEEFELSDTDKDRQNAEKLDVQNRILDTMQKTIQKISKGMDSKSMPQFGLADTLKRGVMKKHGEVEGLMPDYEHAEDSD